MENTENKQTNETAMSLEALQERFFSNHWELDDRERPYYEVIESDSIGLYCMDKDTSILIAQRVYAKSCDPEILNTLTTANVMQRLADMTKEETLNIILGPGWDTTEQQRLRALNSGLTGKFLADALKSDTEKVIRLHIVLKKSQDEIAEMLNISKTDVQRHIHEATVALRDHIYNKFQQTLTGNQNA